MFSLVTCIGNDQFRLDLSDLGDFISELSAEFWLIGITNMSTTVILLVHSSLVFVMY